MYVCNLFNMEKPPLFNPHLASSSVAGAVGMTTSGESESDDSEMGRLQGTNGSASKLFSW